MARRLMTSSKRRPHVMTAPTHAKLIIIGSGPAGYTTAIYAARAMLANAQTILVTADSVNMVGEAAATGAPVHVYEPAGGSPKITRFLNGMVAAGAVRRYAGAFERWDYAPMDPTDDIAREVARRMRAKAATFAETI